MLFCLFVSETGSWCVALASLKLIICIRLALGLWTSCLSLLSAGIYHHAKFTFCFKASFIKAKHHSIHILETQHVKGRFRWDRSLWLTLAMQQIGVYPKLYEAHLKAHEKGFVDQYPEPPPLLFIIWPVIMPIDISVSESTSLRTICHILGLEQKTLLHCGLEGRFILSHWLSVKKCNLRRVVLTDG